VGPLRSLAPRAASVVAASLICACGLSAVGTGGDAPGGGDDTAGGASDASVHADGSTSSSATGDAMPFSGGESGAGGGNTDAGSDAPTYVPPADAGTPILYAASGRFWTLSPTTKTWGGSSQFPTGGCDTLDELAVDAQQRLYGVGNGNLYSIVVNGSGDPTCTRIANGNTYPQALAFAPGGVLDATQEVLVGFQSNGDYVRIDVGTGMVKVITSNALAGKTAGDIVNVGNVAYAAISDNAGCSNNSCLYTFDWKTGALSATSLGNFPTSKTVTGLAHWGGVLFAFADSDVAMTSGPAAPASAATFNGPNGYTGVAYHAAASTSIAPTK
jgi:hypothetical protein